jgi:hypothetical protein
MDVKGLPRINKNITWVTAQNFDIEKLSLSSPENNRVKLLYDYGSELGGVRDLVITLSRNPSGYMECKGVEEEIFNHTPTGKNMVVFTMNGDNDDHIEFYSIFEKIANKLSKMKIEVKFPIFDVPDKSFSMLYSKLIESTPNPKLEVEGSKKVFTTAYTKDDQIDIMSLPACIGRPAFVLSYPVHSGVCKINVQLSQLYVHKEVKVFPLAIRD